MLTAFQCEVVAFQTEYGELFCRECAHDLLDQGDLPVVQPIIRYSLDEEQSYRGEDYCPLTEEDDDITCDCAPAIECESCGAELVEAYYDAYEHEKEEV